MPLDPTPSLRVQGPRERTQIRGARTLIGVRALLTSRMLALHALTLVALLAALALGRWQYGVWQDGRAAQTDTLVHAAPKPLSAVLSPDQAFPGDAVGQPVTLAGRWLPSGSLFVTGREHDGRSGVWAVTPVAVCSATVSCASAPAVLVVRGWARSVAAAPAAPRGPVRLSGWLQPGEGSAVTDPDPDDDVLPQLRVADAVQRVRQDLYGGFVIARQSVPDDDQAGLATVDPPTLPKATVLTNLRNLLYAGEWWFFGGFAVYVWWRWCRDEVTRVTGVPSSA